MPRATPSRRTVRAHETGPRRAPRRSTPEVRALILEAATDLFAERGYNQATMRDVASRAGISLSVMYRHFASKERLFSATLVGPFLESFERFADNQTSTPGEPPGESQLAEFIGDLHQNLATHRHTMIAMLAALEDPDTELIDQVRTGLGDAWRNLQLAAPTAGGNGAAAARMRDANMLVVAMVVGLVVFQPWVIAARDGDDRPLVDLAAVFSAAGIGAAVGS